MPSRLTCRDPAPSRAGSCPARAGRAIGLGVAILGGLAVACALAAGGPASAQDATGGDAAPKRLNLNLAPNSESAAIPLIGWHTALNGNVITVRLEDQGDRYRVERVELIGPGNVRIAAKDITREVEHSTGFSSDDAASKVTLGPHGAGDNDPQVHIGAAPNTRNSYTKVKVAITRAHVRVPDLDAYRGSVADWKFSVRLLDDAGRAKMMEFPAPGSPTQQ